MADQNPIYIGLDLGSTKVAMAAIQCVPGETPEIIGYFQTKCRYLKKGIVINLEVLQAAIKDCIENIHSLVQIPIKSVSVNLSSEKLLTKTTGSSLEFKRKTEIKPKHIQQLHEKALDNASEEWTLMHFLPLQYTLDGQTGIDSPLGMACRQIDSEIYQVYAPKQNVDNIVHSINKCNLGITHMVVEPLASFESLLIRDEKELGIWLVDIGGNTSHIAVSLNGSIRAFPSINIGSENITSDIAIGLKTTMAEAEKIKIEFGGSLMNQSQSDAEIQIPRLGGNGEFRTIQQSVLVEIIHPRIAEIFQLISQTIQQIPESQNYSAGIVLSGGGTLLTGTPEVAQDHFELPIIPGNLRNISGLRDLSPEAQSASAIGLALYAHRHARIKNWGSPSQNPFVHCFKSLFSWLGGNA